jgi:hypothetical protein
MQADLQCMWLLLPCGACPKHQAGPQPGAMAYRLGREEVILAHPAAAGAAFSSTMTLMSLCYACLPYRRPLRLQLLQLGAPAPALKWALLLCCVVCLAL